VKQVLIKKGNAYIEEVPAPRVEKGSLLVRVQYSCISIGTELSSVKTSGMPLWKRAMHEKENVQKVLDSVAARGIVQTHKQVRSQLDAGKPTGYSAAGIVLEVGEGIDDIKPGDRVACAGAEFAHHAEIICVPRNLTVPVPDAIDLRTASTVTLGAIALQGIRRAQPTLGETFVVVGLGILGQLAVQLLKADGCKVIGTDLDKSRIETAQKLGMDFGISPREKDKIEQVFRLTGGIGADGVLITAATASNEIMSTAFRMCRKKGRVVLIGDVGLNLNRADFYQKELDFLISTSYGPGRYDNRYENEGLDYPVAYVRWTENRNMAEYLNQLAENRVVIEPLIQAEYPVDEIANAYGAISKPGKKPLIVILRYPPSDTPISNIVKISPKAAPKEGKIRVAVIGAGNFAKSTHLPNLQSLPGIFDLRAVVSRSGHNAQAIAKQFSASYAATGYNEVLQDPDVDAVIITTRHNLHAEITLAALNAGKHVLVEKPLAINRNELESIRDFYTSGAMDAGPVLLTGFNRRFSPHIIEILPLVRARTNPMIITYRMNAGYIPSEHWVHTAEGGGRNIGEACHIYDLFTALTGSRVKTIDARTIKPATTYYSSHDNFTATVTFEDGSVAVLHYTALGNKDYPKESLEIFTDGKVYAISDYKALTGYGIDLPKLKSKFPDKGHRNELEAFGRCVQDGGDWPIPLWQQLQATEISFGVEELITRT
jgi:predicted dehydrogenase/threonine dehydrogenase-like Zn-dependent dehydrogenase